MTTRFPACRSCAGRLMNRRLSPTARATADRWAVILEAAAIMQAEYDRIESLEARMAEIRKETGR